MSTARLITWFQENYNEIVQSMMNCSHHSKDSLNKFHLEGDVWSHTLLTLDKSKEFSELIQFTLLCHDIGKPFCRKENEGKTSFKGHELLSAYMSLPLSKKYGFNKEDQIKIFKLIAWHTSILKLLEKDNTSNEVLAQHKGHPDLFLDLLQVTKADGLGRVMENYSDKLDFIEDYYSGVLDTMLFNQKDKKEGQKTCYCLIGLPASGKSSYLINNKISKELIIERDEILLKNKIQLGTKLSSRDKELVHKEIEKKKENLVKGSKDIYIDMINLIDRDRNNSLKNIPRNYWFKAIIFIDELENIKERNSKREKKVPLEYYDYLLKNSSLPLFDDFDEIEFIF